MQEILKNVVCSFIAQELSYKSFSLIITGMIKENIWYKELDNEVFIRLKKY